MSHPAFVRVALAAVIAVPVLAGAACNKKTDDAKPAAGPGSAPAAAAAQDKATIKIGMIASFSGPFADISKQLMGGIKTYMKQHGDTVAGKKIELVTRDSTGPLPEVAKRLASELVVQDKVDFLTGFG